ncbi:hypothetical protein DP185_19515 [Enterobacter hormaechei]|nr:hypothetical protein DP185_19515 [Enterobacter hormaechei]
MSNKNPKETTPTSQNENISLTSGIKQLKTAISDRFSNPIFFAFLISWSIFNWDRISVLLYSKKNIIDRIAYIKSMPSNSQFIIDLPHATTIWLPLISTIFLVCLSPYISIGLDLIHKTAINKKIENNEALTQARLTAKSATIEAEVIYENKKTSTELEIKAVQDEVRARSFAAERNIEDLQSSFDTLSAAIENTQKANDRLTIENETITQKIESANIHLAKLDNDITNKNDELTNLEKSIKNIASINQSNSLLDASNSLLRDENQKLKTLVHQLYLFQMNIGSAQARYDMKNVMAKAQTISNEVLNIPNNHEKNQQP